MLSSVPAKVITGPTISNARVRLVIHSDLLENVREKQNNKVAETEARNWDRPVAMGIFTAELVAMKTYWISQTAKVTPRRIIHTAPGDDLRLKAVDKINIADPPARKKRTNWKGMFILRLSPKL